MSESNNYNDQCNITQNISGQNNQVAGRDIIINAPSVQDDKPEPGNPNLITCPECGRFGVSRTADLCPRCNYSFLNERLSAQAEARQQRQKGLSILLGLVIGVLAVAMQISSRFAVSFWNSLGWGVLVVAVTFGFGFWLLVRFNTWNRLRSRNSL